jgi:glycosyltransferase involved in cell wall biosynthesis
MKIMYAYHTLYFGGGIECVTICKANEFVRRGHEVVVCYTQKGSYPWTPRPLSDKVKATDLGVKIVWKKNRILSLIYFIRYIFDYIRKLQREVNKERPDVLICTSDDSKYVVPFIRTPRGKRMIKVREYHNGSYSHLQLGFHGMDKFFVCLASFLDKRLLSRCYDKIFLLTYKDKQDNFPHNNRYEVMYNPLTIPTDDTSDIPTEREKTVLFVGRQNYQKNLQSLLRIGAKTQKEGWTLKLVGEGDQRNKLVALAKELGISDSVEFCGYRQNPSEMMKKASLLCLTSHYEGFSLVTVESFHFGLPLVAFDLPYGPSDLIEDGVNGLLIPNKDEDTFARKLSGLLANRDLIKSMSKAAIDFSRKFEIGSIVDGWLNHYTELLAKK